MTAVTQQVAIDDDGVVRITDIIGQQHRGFIIRRCRNLERGAVCIPVQARVLDDLVGNASDPIHIDAMGVPGVHLGAQRRTNTVFVV